MTADVKALDDRWDSLIQSYPSTRDDCFMMVYDACLNIAKSMCKGVRNTHLDEDALDAAMYCIDCMDRLGHRPRKLSSYCYLRVKKFIYSPKRIREDREVSWEDYQNERKIAEAETERYDVYDETCEDL